MLYLEMFFVGYRYLSQILTRIWYKLFIFQPPNQSKPEAYIFCDIKVFISKKLFTRSRSRGQKLFIKKKNKERLKTKFLYMFCFLSKKLQLLKTMFFKAIFWCFQNKSLVVNLRMTWIVCRVNQCVCGDVFDRKQFRATVPCLQIQSRRPNNDLLLALSHLNRAVMLAPTEERNLHLLAESLFLRSKTLFQLGYHDLALRQKFLFWVHLINCI